MKLILQRDVAKIIITLFGKHTKNMIYNQHLLDLQ